MTQNYSWEGSMREEIIQALKNNLEGLIGWHIMNVNIMLDKAVGVPEHPDLLKTIEEELQAISDYNDKLEVLNKYF
jgi:hypothetical protein|tara:strand:- start:1407 stop:1634 length:228 start_codon:yes stop_codon:yes gene_type:complete